MIVGAGTTELIGLIGQSLREVLALHALERGDPAMPVSHLVEPTYGEYRRASVLNELRTEVWSRHVLGWAQDFLPETAAGVFWTGHPNNPTGRAWDRDRLLALVDDTLGLLTVVDEAFLPFLPDEAERTLIGAVAARDNLLVLRSLTKIFAIPGLAGRLRGRLARHGDAAPPVSGPLDASRLPAEAAALAALDDDDYRERTVRLVASESARDARSALGPPRPPPGLARPRPPAESPSPCPTSSWSA